MKHSMRGLALLGALVLAVSGTSRAEAEYRSPKTASGRSPSSNSNFDDAVDVARFRKGNPEWDSQELMVSGMKALHQEQQKILRELEELKSAVRQLAERKE